MTLSFSTQLNGNPTYFVEKIWSGLKSKYREDIIKLMPEYGLATLNKPKIRLWALLKPKLHTIREDKSNRWKAGNDIHFVINNRTPQRFQFAPVMKCVSVQEIEIDHEFQNADFQPCVYVNESLLDSKEILTLAKNDGFESVEEFFYYFDTDFKGKIIHWTELNY